MEITAHDGQELDQVDSSIWRGCFRARLFLSLPQDGWSHWAFCHIMRQRRLGWVVGFLLHYFHFPYAVFSIWLAVCVRVQCFSNTRCCFAFICLSRWTSLLLRASVGVGGCMYARERMMVGEEGLQLYSSTGVLSTLR